MAMRVGTTEVSQSAITGIMTAYNRFVADEEQVNTGKQLNVPSDNPAGTAQVLNLNAQMADLTQYNSIIDQANNFISSSTSALSSVTTLLTQARTIAVEAANGPTDGTSSASLAGQVQDIITEIGALGNTSDGTQYVFAGQRDTTAPFVANGNGFNYVGGTAATGDNNINLSVGNGQTVTINTTGDTTLVPILNTLTKLSADISSGNSQLISNTDLANIDTQLNNLSGVQANLGSLSDQLTQTKQNNTLSIQNYTKLVTDIQDANIPNTVVDLQTAQTAYEAALESTSKIFEFSLLNFLQ